LNGLETTALATVGSVLVLYLAALIYIGWRAAKRTHGGVDFHLAGRSLGAWAAGVSSTASSESGWVTLGAVGMTYAYGVSGLWYAPGCLLGYLVNLYYVAPRVQALSREQGSLTMTDIIARRWGDPRHVLRLTSVAIILLSMMGYVAAQMTAAGKAFSSTLGLETALGTVSIFGRQIGGGYVLGVLLGAAVITLVTSLGGFRGVAWTDLFQGILMAFALIALPAYAVMRLGGFGALIDGLGGLNPDFLTATGGRATSAAWGFVVGELGIGLGYPGMPHVITRYMAARDEEQVRRLRLIGIVWGVTVFYGAGVVGLVARVMSPELADGERALMIVALQLLPPLLAGLMLAAVISAILSTVSSQLLVAASAVSYDVVEGVAGRHPDDRRSLVLGRWTVAAVGLLGVALALSEVRLVFWFVLFAWSILGAAFGPLILLAVRGNGVNRNGALACMLVGLGVSVAWKLGRGIDDDPGAFALVPWVTVAVAIVILVGGWMAGKVRRGEAIAIVAATAITLGSWVVVQQGAFHQLYELVPAFALAAATAVTVSRFVPARD
jgi:sodium/proline symporter